MAEENKAAEMEQAQATPETPKRENRVSLKDRLYRQIEIMEREQAKIETAYAGSVNPRAARMENLAFAKQITETANAIINIKRGGK